MHSLLNLLGTPPGSLVYHLFTLLSIEATLGIAWGQWQRSRSFRAGRILLAFGGIMGLRVLLFLLALALPAGSDAAQVWIPPFERSVDVISIGLIAWSFIPLLRNNVNLGIGVLVGNTLLAAVACLLFVFFWRVQVGEMELPPDYNLSAQEWAWLLWGVILLIGSIVLLAADMGEERPFVLAAFVSLLFGYFFHALTITNVFWTYPAAHVAAWVRIGQLVFYPALAVAVYQYTFTQLSERSRELQDLSQTSLGQIRGLVGLFEAMKRISSSLDPADVIESATHSIAEAINADQCAIALPEYGESAQLRLVSIHNPSRRGRGEAVTFPLNEQQAIKHSLRSQRQVQIKGIDTNNSQIRFLFALMGSDDVGPVLIQPLIYHETPIGVLIAGNADSRREFSPNELQLCKTLADQVSISIEGARKHQAIDNKAQQLEWTLRNKEMEASKLQAAMEAELKKSREEVALFAQRLYEHETAAKQDKQDLQEAKEQLSTLEKSVQVSRRQIEDTLKQTEHLSARVKSDEEEIKKKESALRKLVSERDLLRQKVQQLEEAALQAEQLADALAKTRERARKLARAVQSQTQTRAARATPPVGVSGQTVLEDLTCGVIITDPSGKVSRVNAAACHMLGEEQEKMVGGKVDLLVEDEPRWKEALQTLSSQEESMVSTQLNVKDRVLRATISPMNAEEEGKGGTVTILYDVTAETESQQARDEFVASLSQELRTPMTSITGYTDLLLGESVGIIGEMQRKFLQRIKANIERMGSMLNDLIGVTAIDASQLEIRPTAIDMAEVIEDTIIGARAQLEEKELTLELNLPESMPLVEADPDCAHQIMANLLGNATKCSPVGSTVGISAAIEEGEEDGLDFLRISVSDSGGGIAPEDQKRVFDRFYRAESALIEGMGETGVGMSIVYSLVGAHGGRVWVDSEMGVGSTFNFLLPISQSIDDPWMEIDVPPLDLGADTGEN